MEMEHLIYVDNFLDKCQHPFPKRLPMGTCVCAHFQPPLLLTLRQTVGLSLAPSSLVTGFE